MSLQAYIDDSYKPNGMFVLAGYIANSDAWAKFSHEWREFVEWGGTIAPGSTLKHFKMSEMASLPERMERVPAFRKVTENHTLIALSCAVDSGALKRVQSRLTVPGYPPINWGHFSNTYLFCFRCLMDMFHHNKNMLDPFISLDQPIDFIFDNQTEKKIVREYWDEYIKRRSIEVRSLYGNKPRFEDDKKSPPLQAADMWAWHVRKWSEEGTIETNLSPKKPVEIKEARRAIMHIEYDEEAILQDLKKLIRNEMGKNVAIADVTFNSLSG